MIPSATPARLGILAGALGLIAVPMVGQANALTSTLASGGAPTVTQDRLTPTTATAGAATSAALTLHAGSCFTAKTVGVGVRDAAGNNLDFPGNRANQRICPSGLSLTTGARTFASGTYSVFGFYQDQAGAWHNLPAQSLTVSANAGAGGGGSAGGSGSGTGTSPVTPPAAPSAPTGSPVPGKALTWSDEFNGPLDSTKWNDSTTTSYKYGSHNPDDNKLDWITPSDVAVANGTATFTAQPSSHTLENGKQAWTTGLLTTEGSQQGFKVKTGDYAEARVQLPSAPGAWPALWTWANGGSEIDSFEYHPDNPNLLELTNHVNSAQKYYTDANAVKPGQWVTIGTYYGATSVDYYVNGVKVFSDNTGVGANWSAYLILNLSISAGQYHPAPSGSAPISFAADYVRVYR
ncbi:glycoside hydrolase family 16 protein [Kitasatospora sp. NBC_01287]|uniref:glycoside hydrolase family 16 protein n=1 Tax=Kitasatospora sp. NBC_01287 TaxID=2903573 RepID=UPI002254FEAE|nr:glycoside hydrolase family 16 protein [Kitasatospora sp. NBC_01287]MCX4745303.1 glycoside hydrolase family 16 protein [Kitasatospora sp. NBC_01287]